MKLLIVTQKVDERDEVLGFMHRWIKEFAGRCEALTVICLEEGTHHLPTNVRVFSLGKERNPSRIWYVLRFWYFIWRERAAYDSVFVHMNQIYVLLGWLVWRMCGKKISLWYAHGTVSTSLRIAEKMTDTVFTSTVSGFRIRSTKVRVVGQGIDTDYFMPPAMREEHPVFKIVMIGRLSPSKDQKTLIAALGILAESGRKFEADIIGSAGHEGQESYAEELRRMVAEKHLEAHVRFVGGVPHRGIVTHLHQADLFVNPGLTGSLDKAGLEAMATGLPVLTCNEAYAEVLGQYHDLLLFEKRNPTDLVKKLIVLMEMDAASRTRLRQSMRAIIVEHHRVSDLVEKIIGILKTS